MHERWIIILRCLDWLLAMIIVAGTVIGSIVIFLMSIRILAGCINYVWFK